MVIERDHWLLSLYSSDIHQRLVINCDVAVLVQPINSNFVWIIDPRCSKIHLQHSWKTELTWRSGFRGQFSGLFAYISPHPLPPHSSVHLHWSLPPLLLPGSFISNILCCRSPKCSTLTVPPFDSIPIFSTLLQPKAQLLYLHLHLQPPVMHHSRSQLSKQAFFLLVLLSLCHSMKINNVDS